MLIDVELSTYMKVVAWSVNSNAAVLLARCENVPLGLQAIVAARRISDFPSVYYHAGITWRLRCRKTAGKFQILLSGLAFLPSSC